MTNFEYYKNEIEAVDYDFAMNKKGAIVKCENSFSCINCHFAWSTGGCDVNKIKWLYEEHIEQPKLTKQDRMLCEILSFFAYIGRNKSGNIQLCQSRPLKKDDIWQCTGTNRILDKHFFVGDYFSFIKWEDEEPWAVSDLLKLEVVE